MILSKAHRAHLLLWWGVWTHVQHKNKSTQMQTQLAGPCNSVIYRKGESGAHSWAADQLSSRGSSRSGVPGGVCRGHSRYGLLTAAVGCGWRAQCSSREGLQEWGPPAGAVLTPCHLISVKSRRDAGMVAWKEHAVQNQTALDSKPGPATYWLCDLGQDT